MRSAHGKDERKRISIVVPLCNEEESMGLLNQKLFRLQERIAARYDVEYCLVDDGSTDATYRLMASVVPPDASCICLHHERNRGIGAAIRTGLKAASGAIVCTIDADCSYSPENLCVLIDLVACGITDIAVASPYHPRGEVIGVKPWRLLLSRMCSLLYRCVVPLKLHTYTSIFRAYSGPAVRTLQFQSDDFVSAVEILLCAHRHGFRVCEVPMALYARQNGQSKIRIAYTVVGHLAMLRRAAQLRMAGLFVRRNRRFSPAPGRADEYAPARTQFGPIKEDNPVL